MDDAQVLETAPASRLKALARWSVLRWVVTGAAVVLFAVLFLGSAETASADTCDAAHNYCYATRWPALDNTYYNWLGYAPTVYAGFPGAGCVLGNYVCDANGVPLYGGYYYGWANGVPNNVFTANGCPVGNYACLGSNGFTYASCPAGNFSCLNANGYYLGYAPWYGGWYPYGYTGVYSGNVTIVAPNGNPVKVPAGVRVAEVSAPVQVPAADPQPAPAPAPVAAPAAAPQPAPAAPAVTQAAPAPQPAPAQVVTALSAPPQPAAPQVPVAAPVSAPTGGSGLGTTVQGASTAVVAAPVADPGNDDHRG
jgi:hypothetical protein